MLYACAVSVGSNIIGRLAEQGIANALNLATLRHGTNVISWIAIHLFGTRPSFGGSSFGGDYGELLYEQQNKGHTFFSYAQESDVEIYCSTGEKVNPLWNTKVTPKEYEHLSNFNLIVSATPKSVYKAHPFKRNHCMPFYDVAYFLIAPMVTILIPTIKVHLTDESLKYSEDFEKDKHELYSYYTAKPISPLNMGVIGSIWQSCTYATPMRILKNPNRVMTGLLQLGMSVFVMGTAVHFSPEITTYRTSIIAGMIIGLI